MTSTELDELVAEIVAIVDDYIGLGRIQAEQLAADIREAISQSLAASK